jgi:hypothetical protein
MLSRLKAAWRNWRENSRQYKIDRAAHKAGHGQGGRRHESDHPAGLGQSSPGGTGGGDPGGGLGGGV